MIFDDLTEESNLININNEPDHTREDALFSEFFYKIFKIDSSPEHNTQAQ